MKFFKIIILLGSFFLLLVGGCYLSIRIAFGDIFTGPHYDHFDQIEHFNRKEAELYAVRDYLRDKMIPGANISIEFAGDKVDIFHLRKDGNRDSNWGSDLTAAKVDSLLVQINWTAEDLSKLRKKLEAADCISIDSGADTRIGWKRSGMGMFFYYLLDDPLSPFAKNYNDSCQYIRYREDVVLEYGGGAIGPQCFPGYGRRH